MYKTKRLIIGIPNNRGVGQSTFLANYIYWAIRHEPLPTVSIFEPLKGNKTLGCIFGSYCGDPHQLTLLDYPGVDSYKWLNRVVNALMPAADADFAVLDDPGASDYLLSWGQSEYLRRSSEFGFETTVLFFFDETETLCPKTEFLMKAVGRWAHVVWARVIKNGPKLKTDLDLARLRLVLPRFSEITAPRLPSAVSSYIGGLEPHGIWEAMQQSRNALLSTHAERSWHLLCEVFSKNAAVLFPRLVPERKIGNTNDHKTN